MRGPLLLLGPLLASACYSEGDPDSEPTSNGGTSSTQTESDPSTSGSTSGSSSTAAVDTSTGPPTSSSESGTTDAAGCGDGDIGPDEDCDDGNDTPGDGCSSCRASGTLLWLETVGAPALLDECYGVALGEGVYAVGSIADSQDTHHGWISRFDRADGVPDWRYDHEDDDNSRFAAITQLDDGGLVAVGIHNNSVFLIGDAWARRFTPTGVSGPEEELSWQVDSGSVGFVDVAAIGSDLVLSASVGLPEGYQIWYGQLPLVSFPSTSFTVETYSGGMGVIAESFDRGGAAGEPRLRATHRTLVDGPDPIQLLGFDAAIVDPPTYSIALDPSDAPVVVAVDDSGSTWVCRTDDDGAAVIMRLSATLQVEDTQRVVLGSEVSCASIVAVADGVVIGGTLGGELPFVAEVDADLELVWSSELDGMGGRVRSIAVDAAGDAVALCGVREDAMGAPTTNALVGLIVR